MTAMAFHDPKKLSRFDQDWRKRALDLEPVTETTIEEMERHADELWARHERSRKGMVS